MCIYASMLICSYECPADISRTAPLVSSAGADPQSELEDVCRRKVATRSFIEADFSTYARADYVAKESGRSRSLVFENGLRFSCKKEDWSTIYLQSTTTVDAYQREPRGDLRPLHDPDAQEELFWAAGA
jgi:hypothetical protein